MSVAYLLLAIVCMSLVTFCIRSLPFHFIEMFKDHAVIKYLALVLPAVIMLILSVFSLKDVRVTHFPYALPELIAVIVTATLHIYKRNVILSISFGVICYGLAEAMLT